MRNHSYPDAASLAAQCHIRQTSWRNTFTTWRVWGEGSPLLLLHGGFGSWTHWIRNIPSLSTRHRVLVPDMLGFGDSGDAPEEHPIEAIACSLLLGLDTFCQPFETIDVAGFSFGTLPAGALAAQLASCDPGRLRKLVLVAPAGLGIEVGSFGDLRGLSPDQDVAQKREVHRTNLGIMMIADPAMVTDETIDLQMINVSRKRLSGKPFSRADVLRKACAALSVDRVEVFFGTRDAYKLRSEPAYSAAVHALHPNVRVHEIKDAGHWVQYERPDEFNAALQSCLHES